MPHEFPDPHEEVPASERERFRHPFFDYPNQIWGIASHFRVTCHGNIEDFKSYIGLNKLPTLAEYYGDEAREGLKEHVGDPADVLDEVIREINEVTDETSLKRLINKALFIVYPKRGLNQEFEGEDNGADRI